MLSCYCFFFYENHTFVFSYSETGASCAMKEVDIIPDDSKSAECIKQLEQVIPRVIILLIGSVLY